MYGAARSIRKREKCALSRSSQAVISQPVLYYAEFSQFPHHERDQPGDEFLVHDCGHKVVGSLRVGGEEVADLVEGGGVAVGEVDQGGAEGAEQGLECKKQTSVTLNGHGFIFNYYNVQVLRFICRCR